MLKTIKTTKQMRLDELIKYIFDNDITGRRFEEISDYKSYSITRAVHVTGEGVVNVEGLFNPDTKFTVSVEEEITEDTVFDNLIEVTKNDNVLHYNRTNISDVANLASKRFYALISGKLELVWERDEECVMSTRN